ncbi:hypothetical protein CPB85DRAFT_1262114 [Mucidula mucida]|nr:hypothetical protein CPB85DRAFT_1262114 [Mucidula mucida]
MSPNEKAKYNAEHFEPWLAGRAAQPVVVLEGDVDDATSADWVDVQEDNKRLQRILKGDERIEISHEGEEYGQILGQVESMVKAFAHWEATHGESWLDCLDFETPLGEARESIPVRVVDMFCSYTGYVTTYSTDPYTATAFVRHGLLPCAPLHPKLAITVRTMEFFRRARLHAPRFSLQAFSATLSDFHERPTRKSFSQQLTVDNEPPMKYAMHGAIDGNNSLVRVELKTEIKEAAAMDTGAAEAASKETEDVGSPEGDGAAASKAVEKTKTAEPMVSSGEPEDSGCEDRWHNMVNDMSSKMWGIYKETGIFLGVCRHGMVLLATDMIRSGELSKYPLAVIERLLNVLHVNSRKPWHVQAWGLALAHQAIRTYFEHMDEIESFQALSLRNSRNARRITEDDVRPWCEHTSEFEQWLNEERAYLTSLKKEPAVETLQMEYYRALLALDDLMSQRTEALKSTYLPNNPQGNRKKERQRRAILKKHELKLEEVVALEDRLDIVERWEVGSLARQELAERVATRDYRLALDKLESLVVARIFELTKMNMSQTGYKLRKHITKALQVRSKAVKTALKKFNDAAARMSPPRPQLAWEEVVAYGFLAEFNVLRDSRNDIQDKGWACEAGRRAMDSYFKILRANEELVRCTTEAIRLLTYMDDEESYLKAVYHGMKEDLPDIAFQIRRWYHLRVQLHADHRKRLRRIQKLDGWDKAEEEGLVKELKPELPGQREADDGEMIMAGAPPEIMSVGDNDNDDCDVDANFDWNDDEEDEREAFREAVVIARISDDEECWVGRKVE